jgi:mannitol/fructose-specific phosphotransferase system IIA component (Ntr-type)
MNIVGRLLSSEDIVVGLDVAGKRQALEEVALLVGSRHDIHHAPIFGAPDRQPVSILFVILVPEHANEEHLQILAMVSEMFADQDFRDQLNAATEATTIQRLFGEWDRGKR